MSHIPENPFDSIESAHQFVDLLAANISDAKRELEADVEREQAHPSRRLDVLRVALYNLKKLESDVRRSRRLLNDLRILRRLLFDERNSKAERIAAWFKDDGMSIPDQRWMARETELLNAAVEKIVTVGEEVGLTPEDMIAFLDSGCSVRDLLVMLAAKRSGAAWCHHRSRTLSKLWDVRTAHQT
jgi:hypothetical protein